MLEMQKPLLGTPVQTPLTQVRFIEDAQSVVCVHESPTIPPWQTEFKQVKSPKPVGQIPTESVLEVLQAWPGLELFTHVWLPVGPLQVAVGPH